MYYKIISTWFPNCDSIRRTTRIQLLWMDASSSVKKICLINIGMICLTGHESNDKFGDFPIFEE